MGSGKQARKSRKAQERNNANQLTLAKEQAAKQDQFFQSQLKIANGRLAESAALRKQTSADAQARIDILTKERTDRDTAEASAKNKAKNRKSRRLALISTGPQGAFGTASIGRKKLLGG
jgi:hypothetical protein